MTDTQNSAPTEMAGWAEWTDGTQNGAGVPFDLGKSIGLQVALLHIDRGGVFHDAPPRNPHPVCVDASNTIAALLARITELEAHIADEPKRMREVVERCAVIAQTHAIRRFATAGYIRDEISAAIRAQETHND